MAFHLLPVTAGIDAYRRQAQEFFDAYQEGDAVTRELIDGLHPRLSKWPHGQYPYAPVTLADIQLAVAVWYYFESWQHLEDWVEEASSPGSRVSSFEAATEAIRSGDIPKLRALLKLYPSLIRHRSMRRHHSTLLHYIGANGIELQEHYPVNAPSILDILLEAGAAVDARADIYGGGDTTLGMVATSIHPARAGVLIPLLDRLLVAGAEIDAPDAGGNRQSIVYACLANGRPEAASYLALRGAHLDLESAAGVGQLDVVKDFFDSEGRLQKPATRQQLGSALNWASEYGHAAVAGFLIDRGADPGESINGMGPLHMALLGGHLATIRLLIERGAPLEERNVYGGTPLGMALWAISHREQVHTWPEKRVDDLAVIETLVSSGAQVGPTFLAALQLQPGSRLKTEIEQLLLRYGIEPLESY